MPKTVADVVDAGNLAMVEGLSVAMS